MKKYIIAFFVSLLLCFTLPVLANEYERLEGTAVVVTDTLNVRKGPSKDYGKMGTLKKDTMVQVIGIVEPDWYVIEYGGEEGYVHKDYVILNLPEEITTEEISDERQISEEEPVNILLISIVSAIIIVIIAMVVTLLKGRDNEEEEEEENREQIPVVNHEDTNMHLGEVSYDTYRLDIDPVYFEDTSTIVQPESIRKKETSLMEETYPAKEMEKISDDNLLALDTKLEEATARIAELQKEVEELKKSKV